MKQLKELKVIQPLNEEYAERQFEFALVLLEKLHTCEINAKNLVFRRGLHEQTILPLLGRRRQSEA